MTTNFKTYFEDFSKNEKILSYLHEANALFFSTLARIEIDSQRLKYTCPSATHSVRETQNFDVFHATLGPVDKTLHIILSQASLQAMTISYW